MSPPPHVIRVVQVHTDSMSDASTREGLQLPSIRASNSAVLRYDFDHREKTTIRVPALLQATRRSNPTI
jgi:hypothetical protein